MQYLTETSCIREIILPGSSDNRGSLIYGQHADHIPFEIKRVYCLLDTDPEATRGHHAHRDLEQVIVCLAGSFTLCMEDGVNLVEMSMACPNRAVFVSGLVWRTLKDFQKGTVVLVLASKEYSEDDYIREYDEFRLLVRKEFS